MTRLARWDPFRDLMSFREDMDRVLGSMGSSREAFSGQWTPALDVYEQEDGFVIHVDLPGMSAESIDVTLDQNLLTIRGERTFREENQEASYHRLERRYGAFVRSVSLPSQVDGEGIHAEFSDGVLTVNVPKAEAAKPRKIKIGEGAVQLNA